MNNKLMDLNNVLFEQLERLQEAESNEELETELKRANAVTGVSSQIVKNAALMLDAEKIRLEYGYDRKGWHMPHNTVPVGTIALNGDGYYVIKLRDDPGLTQREKWMAYHRYLYEQHYGVKLGKRDIIIFLDGDRTNCDIKNLKRISKRENQCINSKGLRFKDPELTKVGVGIARVATFRKEDDT